MLIFRSARASWNTFVSPSVSPSARKIWITHIKAYMPQESSEYSSNQPDCPMGSPRCSPWPPWDPQAPPHQPPMTPQTGLSFSLNSSDHLACFSNHQMTHQMSLLILWDILPLPLKGTFQKRFSGFCPLRGSPPPYPLNGKSVWKKEGFFLSGKGG